MANITGFTPKTLKFLKELEANNNREWFQDNKTRYETEVMEPAFAFISEIGGALPKISKHFVAIPKRTGGSLMRVYRDTRFSKGKEPYKTNIGIQFRHERGKDVHAPGFYFHLDKNECFLAVGMWHPEKPALDAIRDAIDENPTKWKRARDNAAFRNVFTIGGSSLKRAPRGYAEDHPLIEDLKRKDHIASCSLPPNFAVQDGMASEVADMFTAGKSYMKFLCEALGLAF